MTNEPLDVSIDKPLEVDDSCDVQWREGNQSLRAKVIERRPLNYRKRKKLKETSMPPVESLKANEIEYYVHYESHDR
jgi:hypothetical protein